MFHSFNDCVYCVVCVCCKLVRCVAIVCFECCCKGFCRFCFAVSCKWCKEHNAFCKSNIVCTDFFKDAIETVAAEECYVKTNFVSLCDDVCCFLCVDWKKEKVSAGIFNCLKLYGEVCVGLVCKCLFCYNFETVFCCCCNKGVSETVGVVVGFVIDDSNFFANCVVFDKVCCVETLCGVFETNAEAVVVLCAFKL